MTTCPRNSGPYMAVDLELDQPGGEIIRIGFAVGHLHDGSTLEWGSYLVRKSGPVDSYVTGLTGIDSDRLAAEGVELGEAYAHLRTVFMRLGCHQVPLVWGVPAKSGGRGGFCDSTEIQKQLERVTPGHFAPPREPYIFADRWIDVMRAYRYWAFINGHEPRGRLVGALEKMGLSFAGRHHDAGDDALNTLRAAAFLATHFEDLAAVPNVAHKKTPGQTPTAPPKPKKRPEQIAAELATLIDSALVAAGAGHASADGREVVISETGTTRRLSLRDAGRFYRRLSS